MEMLFVLQTLSDFAMDQFFWRQPGRRVQGGELESRTFRVVDGRIAPGEPLINLTVLDLGPCRLAIAEPADAPAMADAAPRY